jgi:hypothetical protein
MWDHSKGGLNITDIFQHLNHLSHMVETTASHLNPVGFNSDTELEPREIYLDIYIRLFIFPKDVWLRSSSDSIFRKHLRQL